MKQILQTLILILLVNITKSYSQSTPAAFTDTWQGTAKTLNAHTGSPSGSSPIFTTINNYQNYCISNFMTGTTGTGTNGSTTNLWCSFDLPNTSTTSGTSVYAIIGSTYSNVLCSVEYCQVLGNYVTVRPTYNSTSGNVTKNGSPVYCVNGQKFIVKSRHAGTIGGKATTFIQIDLGNSYSQTTGWIAQTDGVSANYLSFGYTTSNAMATPVLNLLGNTNSTANFSWTLQGESSGLINTKHELFMSINGSGFNSIKTIQNPYPNNNSTVYNYSFTAGNTYTFYVKSTYNNSCFSQSNNVSFTIQPPPCTNTSSYSSLTVCQSELPYSWNGLTFNSAGTQTAHITNTAGCDSAATLNLNTDNISSSWGYIGGQSIITTLPITNQYVCNGPAGNTYTWNYTGTAANVGQTGGNNCTLAFDASSTSGDLTVVATSINGCQSQTFTLHIDLAILPIKLLSFDVTKRNENSSLIEWESSVEINAKGYEIERCKNGKDFLSIGYTDAKSFGNKYSFIDEKPFDGINYYRLRLIDKDGKYEYSKIKTVVFIKLSSFDISVYPNPATDIVNVEFKVSDKIKQLKLIDISGKVLLLINNVPESGRLQIPVANLIAGSYLIEAINGNGISVKKFVKK